VAAWTNARPEGAIDLFEASYPDLWTKRQSEVADALDRAAFYFVKTSSCFSAVDRPLAVAHYAAHLMESGRPTGLDGLGGGPLSSATTERGGRSYAVAPVGTYVSHADFLLQSTPGGRAYLQLRNAQSSLTAIGI
jgi:hypothetical protein